MGKVKPEWVIKVTDELKQIADSSSEQYRKKLSIYRLPAACFTDQNKEAYMPHTVSFVPYHHHQKHLQPMEDHKRRALHKFLKRSNKPLEAYIDSLVPVVQDLKDSYESLDAAFQQDTDAFLQLMILDGCFMLEILQKSSSIDDSQQHRKSCTCTSTCTRIPISFSPSSDGDDSESGDPVFSNHGKLYIMPYIKRDMLMIENQLPMMLLHKLLAAQNDKPEELINNLIHKFYRTNAPVSSRKKCLHVLDLYRKSLLSEDSPLPKKVHQCNNEIIGSAMELHEAGIQFRKSVKESVNDISFEHGYLKLPQLLVDDAKKSMFLNLIAFERFHVGAGNEVTSYIIFMDSIIDNEKDVTLLKSKGIIQNAIGSDKAVADLFNSLSKDITLEPDSKLDIVHKNVNNYCEKRWNKWRANLIHTYFTNPWAILSLVAAIFLFAFTITQTIYTVFPYYSVRLILIPIRNS